MIEDEEVLDNLYKGDKVMEEIKKEMDSYIREIDEILFYNEEDLQRQIEEEMTEKGLKEGIEQGESQKAIEIAKSLLTMGILSSKQIAEVTKLTIDEVEKLKES